MEKNEIEIYLHTILKKQLQKLNISNYGLYSIMDNVRIQLNSIIKHWSDDEFLNAIFSTVVEEGHFYEPYVSDKIGNLVTLGIRNSLLEIAASVDYKNYGLKQDLSVQDIKEITSKAILYFKDVNMDDLEKRIDSEDNYYYNIAQKYKVAYSALVQLGNCSTDELEREFPKAEERYVFDEIMEFDKDVEDSFIVRDLANGISEEIPPMLVYRLSGIYKGESSYFYVDSFKYLSRNFEKNLKVLQFVITNNAKFVTNNFLFMNGYVSKRNTLIRASHGNYINLEAIRTITEISEKHGNELEELAKSAMEIE